MSKKPTSSANVVGSKKRPKHKLDGSLGAEEQKWAVTIPILPATACQLESLSSLPWKLHSLFANPTIFEALFPTKDNAGNDLLKVSNFLPTLYKSLPHSNLRFLCRNGLEVSCVRFSLNPVDLFPALGTGKLPSTPTPSAPPPDSAWSFETMLVFDGALLDSSQHKHDAQSLCTYIQEWDQKPLWETTLYGAIDRLNTSAMDRGVPLFLESYHRATSVGKTHMIHTVCVYIENSYHSPEDVLTQYSYFNTQLSAPSRTTPPLPPPDSQSPHKMGTQSGAALRRKDLEALARAQLNCIDTALNARHTSETNETELYQPILNWVNTIGPPTTKWKKINALLANSSAITQNCFSAAYAVFEAQALTTHISKKLSTSSKPNATAVEPLRVRKKRL